jgi:hypothetical protein
MMKQQLAERAEKLNRAGRRNYRADRAPVIGNGFDTVALGTVMREQLQARLEILKREDRAGQARLQELEQQEVSLRETLLRISGAIQVLEELLAEEKSSQTGNPEATSAQPTTGA